MHKIDNIVIYGVHLEGIWRGSGDTGEVAGRIECKSHAETALRAGVERVHRKYRFARRETLP